VSITRWQAAGANEPSDRGCNLQVQLLTVRWRKSSLRWRMFPPVAVHQSIERRRASTYNMWMGPKTAQL